MSHESVAVTPSILFFSGKSRTKASFSPLARSLLEGSLARKPCFHPLHAHFLREVSHERFVFNTSTFRFWGKPRTKCVFEITAGRNVVLCSTNRASEDGRGRSAARRFRNGLGYVRMLGSVPHCNWQLGLHFHNLQLHFAREVSNESFISREVSHESFVFTTSTFSFWGKSCTKASLSHLQLPVFQRNNFQLNFCFPRRKISCGVALEGGEIW